jgi:rod shape determining protein RodA
MVLSGPLLWNLLHGYQKQRILTFLNPEQDPLGAGYHIIQSKIAVGSGGIVGKGFLHGTQSHLAFLPEHTTDFIFAVASEEFGFLGATLILVLVILITLRIFYISLQAQSAYTRLLSASLGITFLCSSLINMGMVSGILPVVGIPLPFISYGGSALLINLIEFGILMSIATHKKLWNR